MMKSAGGSTVVPPSSKDSANPPVYRSVNFKSPAITEIRYHPWEELDELEYVADDEDRHTAESFRNVEIQPPSLVVR